MCIQACFELSNATKTMHNKMIIMFAITLYHIIILILLYSLSERVDAAIDIGQKLVRVFNERVLRRGKNVLIRHKK